MVDNSGLATWKEGRSMLLAGYVVGARLSLLSFNVKIESQLSPLERESLSPKTKTIEYGMHWLDLEGTFILQKNSS